MFQVEIRSYHISVVRMHQFEDGCCACGVRVGDMYLFRRHVEQRVDEQADVIRNRWPTAYLQTFPFISNVQDGVFAKNSFNFSGFLRFSLSLDVDVNSFSQTLFKQVEITQIPNSLCISQRIASFLFSSVPAGFVPFTAINSKSEVAIFPAQQWDYFLTLKSDDETDIRAVVDALLDSFKLQISSASFTLGFKHREGRDLTGFIDGTKNADHLLRPLVDSAVIAEGLHCGGSFVYAGRFVHDMAKFSAMTTEQKTSLIGRKYDVEQPVAGRDGRVENPRFGGPPFNQHVFRSWGEMYRQSYPFRDGEECGLFFCSFAKRVEETLEALKRMAGHYAADGAVDNLLQISQSTENAFFYAPSIAEIRSIASTGRGDVLMTRFDEEADSSCVASKHCGRCDRVCPAYVNPAADVFECFDCGYLSNKS